MNRIRAAHGVIASFVVLLAACSSGGSIDIGRGQQADPGTVDFPVAYVKRTIPADDDDLRQQRDTTPDADLYLRASASPSATEINITARRRTAAGQHFDIKDVDVSPDGTKLIFAMRGPLKQNQNERKPPFWEIWEYDIVADQKGDPDALHRLIQSDIAAADGNDIAPQYLPDGRVVFSSTRQSGGKAVLLDEGKPGFEAQTEARNESAFLLHVMNADGTDIHQITFNQSHDLWPAVLADGRIVFTRWDAATGRGMHLYTVNPDGTNLQLLYGARSHQTGSPDTTGNPSTIEFARPREMQDGRILALTRPFTGTDFGGDLVLIDTRAHVENCQLLGAAAVAGCAPAAQAQTRATPNQVSTVPGPSAGGRFRSAYPLWDGTNRLLVSWSLCRLLDNSTTPAAIVPCTADRLDAADFKTRYAAAPPLYSAFIFNPADNTFKPLFNPVEGVMITDLVAAQPRTPPATLLDHSIAADDFDPQLAGPGLGLLEIRSVYDFDGTLDHAGAPDLATLADPAQRTAAQRPARFVRLEKAVSIGDHDLDADFPDIDFGAATGASGFMREILGYAPVEPDGSVSIRVPADTAFVVSVLDANGRRIFPQHGAWLQLRPGEIRRCNGCHEPPGGAAADRSHGRDGTSIAVAGANTGAALAFRNTLAATSANAMPGDTMAQARARTSCVAGSQCSQTPGVDLRYDDVWTDPAVRAADTSTALTYGGASGLTTLAPVRASCQQAWSGTCRIVINYVQHIHPLWYVVRDNGLHTCTNCHAPTDTNGVAQVPAGDLDLSDGDSQQVPTHKNAYEQLLNGGNQQQLVNGVLVPVTQTVPVIDPDTGQPVIDLNTGLPETEQVPVRVPGRIQPQSANGSPHFFGIFAAGGTHEHYGLTAAELRLLSEWVDIGAQYFNDPFAQGVPLN
ncbi:MAG TPA: hypothetical protein VMH77_09730 [Steroidobacteraceae bacterium]|nr:hypothetical protein [Steroidobacteraceae bacterium]